MGHEFIGVVESVGTMCGRFKEGFSSSSRPFALVRRRPCEFCRRTQTSCLHGGPRVMVGRTSSSGGQGEAGSVSAQRGYGQRWSRFLSS